MSRILIAGCGYVGTATADLFHQSGWEVQGWTNSEKSATDLAGKPYPVIAVDITNRRQVGERPENFDAVIHCASTRGGDADLYRRVYLDGVRELLDRFIGSTLIFTSSTSVYAQDDGSWVTEASETQPKNETSQLLLQTEALVLARGGMVGRLAGIYGPGRSALLRKFLEGEATIDPQDDRFVNQVHRDDIAAALFRLLDQQAPGPGIYNVVDNQPMLRSDCYRWLAQKLGQPTPPIGESTSPAKKRGVTNKRVSNAKLRGSGWLPQFPTFEQAMEKSILPSFGLSS